MTLHRPSLTKLLFAFLILFITVAAVHAAADEEKTSDKATTNNDVEDDNDDIAAEIAAEEAAAAVGEDALEDEDDGEADAFDEDADSARYDPDLRHPLSELPPSSDDMNIGYSFTTGISSRKKKNEQIDRPLITLGEKIKTIVGVSNQGRQQYHIWGVMASLNRDTNFNVYIQNFSYTIVNHTINSNDELSFTYEFVPNDRLDVSPFQLAITVFYEARSAISGNAIRGHSTTFFNETVLTQPGPQIISNNLFMFFFIIFVAAIGAAWYVFKNLEQQQQQENQKETKASREIASDSSASTSSKNEWLEDHLGHANSGGGRAKSKSKNKKQ